MRESLTLSRVIRHPSSAAWPVLHLPTGQDDVESVKKKINTAQKTFRLHLLEDDVDRCRAKIMSSTWGAATASHISGVHWMDLSLMEVVLF